MVNTTDSVALIGWANSIASSPYTYGVSGGIFFIALLTALWFLFRKTKPQHIVIIAQSEHPTSPAVQSQGNVSSQVYERIISLNGTEKSVLLAGAGLECLPVTIPIQTAVRLAANSKKVLLIDLDTRRNAVAKVFDLSDDVLKKYTSPKPFSSPVENLFLWPADFFIQFKQMNLRGVIQSAETQFDCILINAPYLDSHPDRKFIAACTKRSIVFCKTTQQFDRLRKLLAASRCQLLEEKPLCG